MIDERHEELASLYALDLLEGAERARFEAEMRQDPDLQDLVRDLRNAATALAHAAEVTTPPDELKTRVLTTIAASPASDSVQSDNVMRPPLSVFRAYLPWIAAAGFAVGAGWLAERYSLSRGELALTHTQESLANLALQSARNQLEAERILATRQLSELNTQLADRDLRLATANSEVAALTQQLKTQGDLANFKITTLASMLNNSPQALAVAVWNPAKQEGVLQVEKLPALAADKTYQLWVVDPQYPAPVDGGVFSVDPAGAARVAFKSKQPVNVINAFAVTLERKGGVPKAEGPFVLLGK